MSNATDKTLLLQSIVKQACTAERLAGMEVTVEKEILHYDIMSALSQAGLLSQLVFQGGTCLRMAYGSQRLSEDLDFVGGVNFSPADYDNLAQVLLDYFQPRYGLSVQVKTPKNRRFLEGSIAVGRWMVSIETRPQSKDLPHQKIKLEVANVPSYSGTTKALKLNYPSLQSGLSMLLVNCETQEEILADKIVALCLRKFIKARDLWDLLMLTQQGAVLNDEWVFAKFQDYKSLQRPNDILAQRMGELSDYWLSGKFEQEMMRFLPPKKVEETLGNPAFMPYFSNEIEVILSIILQRWKNEVQDESFLL